MKTVAVDFDGVIHRYGRGWQDGSIYDQPVPGAFDGLRTLMVSHAVFIFTSREPGPVAVWLSEHGGFDTVSDHGAWQLWDQPGRILVTQRKLPASVYIDDRGIRFTGWPQALTDVAEAVKA